MDTQHPIKKKPDPIPHDPRNEPIPEGKPDSGSRSAEEAERKARKEEGLDMKNPNDQLPSGKETTAPDEVDMEIEDEYGLPTGIHTGKATQPERIHSEL